MSCPVIHGGANNNNNKKLDETMQSIKALQDSLLMQPCLELRKKFDGCRVTVAEEKNPHCADIAESFLACEKERMRKQKAFFGGKANWSLFEIYHDCVKNENGDEAQCLGKVKDVTNKLLLL